ncbi:hypothetical protein ACIRQO_36380 [Streptomyces anulatus]|uniref:hypothetical protein n=1 Tax=Streptomyces anulatus TaxID=1892 RepID=UPI002254AB5F|nr:hypothetical protein [Streptomyces anulatus]MCX4523954.1 hypothetical protein [Streptomyces anulatus]WSU78969.1 hypothetical protein OG499_39060 [Streptomyces anulatus]
MRTTLNRLSAPARWVLDRTAQGRRNGDDRGDISITTVIIWVAAVAGALAIAGTIAAVLTKYNGLITGI